MKEGRKIPFLSLLRAAKQRAGKTGIQTVHFFKLVHGNRSKNLNLHNTNSKICTIKTLKFAQQKVFYNFAKRLKS
jgi:hypothetical protein